MSGFPPSKIKHDRGTINKGKGLMSSGFPPSASAGGGTIQSKRLEMSGFPPSEISDGGGHEMSGFPPSMTRYGGGQLMSGFPPSMTKGGGTTLKESKGGRGSGFPPFPPRG